VTDFARLLGALKIGRVEFILVGGVAAAEGTRRGSQP